MTRVRQDKLQEALELLNEAATEKKAELYEMMNDKYANIKNILTEKTENGKAAVTQAKKQLMKALEDEEDKLVKKAAAIDKKVRRNPWPLLGAVAVGSIILGVLAGKK